MVALEDASEELAGVGLGDLGDLLGGAVGHDRSAAVAALGTHVEHAVGHLDDVEVVLDDQHRVSGVDQTLEHVDELAHVLEVQARGGLVEDVERLAGLRAVQLLGKLNALRLAAGESRCRLPEMDVSQAHVGERLQLLLDLGDVREEGERLVNGHVEHVGNGLAVVLDLERLAVVTLAVADLAGHVDVRQEVHLDLDLAVALAGLAAATAHVEREAARAVTAHAALGHRRVERAQVVPQADVRRRVGARRAADGALVDVDHFVDELDALDLLVRAHRSLGAVHGVGERRSQRVGDKRGLAGTGDARDNRERAQLYLRLHVLEVVCRGARNLDGTAAGIAALGRQLDLFLAGEIRSGHGLVGGRDLLGRAGGDHVTAELACAGAHVDDVVRGTDGVLVVLDHDDGVALVTQALQRLDQTVVVALVKADGRLVQDVEHAHEASADLCGEADALRLAARERRRRARECEVIEADVNQEPQASHYLLDHGPRDELLAVVELQPLEEDERVLAREVAGLLD